MISGDHVPLELEGALSLGSREMTSIYSRQRLRRKRKPPDFHPSSLPPRVGPLLANKNKEKWDGTEAVPP